MAYGDNMSMMNFAWCHSLNYDCDEPRTSHAIFRMSNDLPTFHTRQMHKHFIERCSRTVTASEATLQHICGALRDLIPFGQLKIREKLY